MKNVCKSLIDQYTFTAGVLMTILLGRDKKKLTLIHDVFQLTNDHAACFFSPDFASSPAFDEIEMLRGYVEEPKWFINTINLSEYNDSKFSINVFQKGIGEDHSKIHKYISITRTKIMLMGDAPMNKVQECVRSIPFHHITEDDLNFFLTFIGLN